MNQRQIASTIGIGLWAGVIAVLHHYHLSSIAIFIFCAGVVSEIRDVSQR